MSIKKKEVIGTMAKKNKIKTAVENLKDEQIDWFAFILEHTNITFIISFKNDHFCFDKADRALQ